MNFYKWLCLLLINTCLLNASENYFNDSSNLKNNTHEIDCNFDFSQDNKSSNQFGKNPDSKDQLQSNTDKNAEKSLSENTMLNIISNVNSYDKTNKNNLLNDNKYLQKKTTKQNNIQLKHNVQNSKLNRRDNHFNKSLRNVSNTNKKHNNSKVNNSHSYYNSSIDLDEFDDNNSANKANNNKTNILLNNSNVNDNNTYRKHQNATNINRSYNDNKPRLEKSRDDIPSNDNKNKKNTININIGQPSIIQQHSENDSTNENIYTFTDKTLLQKIVDLNELQLAIFNIKTIFNNLSKNQSSNEIHLYKFEQLIRKSIENAQIAVDKQIQNNNETYIQQKSTIYNETKEKLKYFRDIFNIYNIYICFPSGCEILNKSGKEFIKNFLLPLLNSSVILDINNKGDQYIINGINTNDPENEKLKQAIKILIKHNMFDINKDNIFNTNKDTNKDLVAVIFYILNNKFVIPQINKFVPDKIDDYKDRYYSSVYILNNKLYLKIFDKKTRNELILKLQKKQFKGQFKIFVYMTNFKKLSEKSMNYVKNKIREQNNNTNNNSSGYTNTYNKHTNTYKEYNNTYNKYQ